jgi:hypothetical protein
VKAKTLKELRNTPTEKLIEEHDAMVGNVVVGVACLLDELRRREAARREVIMVWFTVAIFIFTAVNVAVFVLSLPSA